MEKKDLKKVDWERFNVVVLVDKKEKDWDDDSDLFDVALPVKSIFGSEQITKDGGGAVNSLTFVSNSNPSRIDSFSFPVDTLILSADASNTASINVGNKNNLNYPLPAGSTLTLRKVIPANVFVSSASSQTLHIIYAGGDLEL